MKNLLVTGATGFFGKAFVRRALEIGAERVCVYSRDEHKQALMRTEFCGEDRLRFFIGDVRDKDRLRRALEGVETVVHASALKRIEVGFYNPDEMVKTNVNGATNVIEASASAGVKKVVALSTDKAFEPVSPYGQSKAIAETLFLVANGMCGANGPKFSICRYGNVSGSTGSVIPIWREAMKISDTVMVTDPDCTRFWMTRSEAVELVINTINIMKGGELVIPTLPAYRLGDLAEAMGANIKIIGLGKWEKKHESMQHGMSSDKARRMTVDELRQRLLDI